MIWAIRDNERIKATRNQRKATCPLCDEDLIAKCGDIKIWHWSHKKDFVCDSFGELETPWHLEWKEYFEKECQEVIIGKHRADIKTKNGLVLEIQNSQISAGQIEEREKYYKNMIWILNGNTIAKNLKIYKKSKKSDFKFNKFIWKWFPKSWEISNKKLYIDLGKFLFEIKEENPFWTPFSGKGLIHSKDTFIIEHGGKPW